MTSKKEQEVIMEFYDFCLSKAKQGVVIMPSLSTQGNTASAMIIFREVDKENADLFMQEVAAHKAQRQVQYENAQDTKPKGKSKK